MGKYYRFSQCGAGLLTPSTDRSPRPWCVRVLRGTLAVEVYSTWEKCAGVWGVNDSTETSSYRIVKFPGLFL